MKTLKGEGIKYIVDSAKQAKRLEDAINDLPLTLGIDSFLSNFKPPIFVYEVGVNEILIRPSQGRFDHGKTKYGEEIRKMKKDNGEYILEHKGIKYKILNEPLFEA